MNLTVGRTGLPRCFALMAAVGCGGESGAPSNSASGSVAVSIEAAENLEAIIEAVPTVEGVVLDREMALSLAALPLACIDRPQSLPRSRTAYLDERTYTRIADYEETRAFYGCYDWHSAVNSTWALLRILKDFPDLQVARLIREKLDDHLSEAALDGELQFFDSSQTFERPYGWAWALTLYAELAEWDDSDGKRWSANVEPLAELFAERLPRYLENLRYPIRVGTHNNTAFAFTMILDYAEVTGNDALAEAVTIRARDFFAQDTLCPIAYEPSGADFLSPCLEEAKLMSRVLPPDQFIAWFNGFVPAADVRAFRALATAVRQDADADELEEADLLAAESHLIGLALIRAEAMISIADALPEGDARVDAFRALARYHARQGFDAMFDADYLGTHWIGTFALRYLLAADK